jgi:hypothetical protein
MSKLLKSCKQILVGIAEGIQSFKLYKRGKVK